MDAPAAVLRGDGSLLLVCDARLEQEVATLGRPIQIDLVQGPPASVITHAAERGNHDLIAVGAHGHRGVRRLLLGSVAEKLTREDESPVILVPAPENPSE